MIDKGCQDSNLLYIALELPCKHTVINRFDSNINQPNCLIEGLCFGIWGILFVGWFFVV